ncbi:MAG: histidinol-phosphate transaminase [Thiohalomonas sp.]|nr:histidinol-phosphate transaminase [Thiohalomonas sp.]
MSDLVERNMAKRDIVKHWIRDDIRELSAYHVPDPGKKIKLDAMENPYLWPDEMKQQWLSQLADIPVNRYPDPSAAKLTKRLEQVMNVPQGMSSILGNGSDELIQIICMALAKPDSVVMAPEPTFVMYQMIARFTNMNYQGIPLDGQFQLDMSAMLEAIETHQPAVIFLAYPNNPTGNLFSQQDVKRIIEMAPGLVVVDEAYHAFAGHSFMAMLSEYDNLAVMRSVSKMGLAGLRLGILCARNEWITEFDKVRLPYNINVLTQFSAEFALEHDNIIKQQTDQICSDREILKEAMAGLKSIIQYPSAANFILFKVENRDSNTIFEALKQSGVLIKRLADKTGPLLNCLRVTVGTADENQAFIESMKNILL